MCEQKTMKECVIFLPCVQWKHKVILIMNLYYTFPHQRENRTWAHSAVLPTNANSKRGCFRMFLNAVQTFLRHFQGVDEVFLRQRHRFSDCNN